ncbi:uncharacterized protein LOC123688679 [Harmonia axyridis]|uniref:uncharacterized protein LOC123688679 n=1 Tax=Harmonia axyridis TaxID=115357 RepID=UPI001E276405|nr:uncharacterized protein LOC123688679 [Harmonia axyridis]
MNTTPKKLKELSRKGIDFYRKPHNIRIMRSIFAKEKEAAMKKKDYDRANQLDIRLDELDQMWRNLEEAAIAQKHAANNAEEAFDPFTRRPTRPAPRVVPKPPPQPRTAESNGPFKDHLNIGYNIKMAPQPALPVGAVREAPRPEGRILVPKRTHNLESHEMEG